MGDNPGPDTTFTRGDKTDRLPDHWYFGSSGLCVFLPSLFIEIDQTPDDPRDANGSTHVLQEAMLRDRREGIMAQSNQKYGTIRVLFDRARVNKKKASEQQRKNTPSDSSSDLSPISLFESLLSSRPDNVKRVDPARSTRPSDRRRRSIKKPLK